MTIGDKIIIVVSINNNDFNIEKYNLYHLYQRQDTLLFLKLSFNIFIRSLFIIVCLFPQESVFCFFLSI